MAQEDPYFIEVDVNGCERCGAGKTWTVVGPDGMIGQSFEDKEAAAELAAYMNEGYWCGAREAFKAGFMAHPEAEAPVFRWSFDPKTCSAADREPSAWEAWESASATDAVDPSVAVSGKPSTRSRDSYLDLEVGSWGRRSGRTERRSR